jgi:hypothetical protein
MRFYDLPTDDQYSSDSDYLESFLSEDEQEEDSLVQRKEKHAKYLEI